MQSNLLQRKCGCGQSASLTGQCSECQRKKLASERGSTDSANASETPPVVHEVLRSSFPKIQPKLKIGAPNDKYEQEADRIANQIMRMPESEVQQQVEPEKEGEESLQTNCSSSEVPEMSPEIAASIQGVQQNAGQPLPPNIRALMEPRFGHNFSQVRIHTGSSASAATRIVNARAFTIGRDIVFGANQYAPSTEKGKRLLAHELTHTIQQNPQKYQSLGTADDLSARQAHEAVNSMVNHKRQIVTVHPASLQLQRACGSDAIGSVGGCIGVGGQDLDVGSSSDNLYLFIKDCDEFKPNEEMRLQEFARTILETETVEVHGFASEEGDIAFNNNLSCARAQKAAAVVARESASDITFYQHGATPGARDDRRSAVITTVPASNTEVEIEEEQSKEEPPQEKNLPGRDYRVEAPSHPAWAPVTPTYLLISRGEPYEFPHYLRVRVDDKAQSGGKWNVVAQEGFYKGSDADIDPAKLKSTATYETAGLLEFDKTKEQLWYGGNGPIEAFTQDTNPVPNGTYDLEIPDFQHNIASKYGDYATTWFRIGHSGDRYLHPGHVSLGCSTVRETDQWPNVWRYLIRRRKDNQSVGTINVV